MNTLASFADSLRGNDEIRVGVITGAGGHFCAGADLGEFLASLNASSRRDGRPDFLDIVFSTFEKLRAISIPLIAAVNGPTLAGGLELVLCCDLVIAAESATFADGHANYGIIPGGGASALLPRLLPINIARYLMLTGEALSAQQMLQHGLVNRVVKASELETTTWELAQSLASKSPLVLAQMKRLAGEALSKPLRDAVIDEFLSLRNHTRSIDLNEGLTAFKEKRRPRFVGR